MYICICKGVTDKQLEEKYIQYQGNMKQILKSLGVGSDCGVCLKEAVNHIRENKKNKYLGQQTSQIHSS